MTTNSKRNRDFLNFKDPNYCRALVYASQLQTYRTQREHGNHHDIVRCSSWYLEEVLELALEALKARLEPDGPSRAD